MLADYNWKTVYRTGDDDILNDFYLPALSQTKYYDRAVGYFSSELLVNAANGISALISAEGRMRLIIGHPLDPDEYDAVKNGQNHAWLMEPLQNRLLEILSSETNNLSAYRLSLLTWLVACGKLEIKFACRKKGMYHEKIGIMTDASGDKLVFQGSANETVHAMDSCINAESLSVYPSWTDSYDAYGKYYDDAFTTLWEGRQKDTLTFELPSETYEKVAKLAANRTAPDLELEKDIEEQYLLLEGMANISVEPEVPKVINGNKFLIRDHQVKALEAWKANGFRGILKLATGSGKTITAIYGSIKIYESWKTLCVIIAVPYVELANQWIENLRLFKINSHACFISKASWYDKLKTDVQLFKSGHLSFLPIVVVNDTLSTSDFQELLKEIDPENILLIGDECHRHGAESRFKALPAANYRMGLSATPFRDDDDEIDSPFPDANKDRIIEYYGDIVSEYTLSDAINDDVLVPYEYHIHATHLSEEEQDDYEELSKKIANVMSSASGAPEKSSERQSLTILCGQRSRLLGEVEEKFTKLRSLIEADKGKSKKHCLFYCPEGRSDSNETEEKNIDRISKILASMTWRTSQFTSNENKREREKILQTFYVGGIDALVSMKVLDEGIDIPACRTAFILASTRNPRQYVQRRGRILRKAEDKEFAVIHDFVVLPSAGREDSSASKQLIRAELERINDFLMLALNKKQVNEELKMLGVIE
ncbi:MAG: DEAD/DEAH box helicase family protein, partial [Methylococcales bacterium]